MAALRRSIGGRIFYCGYRILPEPTRRGVQLLVAVGQEWAKINTDLMSRAMSGENLDITINLETIDNAAAVPSNVRGGQE